MIGRSIPNIANIKSSVIPVCFWAGIPHLAAIAHRVGKIGFG